MLKIKKLCGFYMLILIGIGSSCTAQDDQDKFTRFLSRISEGPSAPGETPKAQELPASAPSSREQITFEGGTPREKKTGFCGDGIINGNEYCDGSAVDDKECTKLHGYSGNITCDPNCFLDISDCITPKVDVSLGGITENCRCNCNGDKCSGGCQGTGELANCRYICDNECICNCEQKLENHIEDCRFFCDCSVLSTGSPDCSCVMTECRTLVVIKPHVSSTIR